MVSLFGDRIAITAAQNLSPDAKMITLANGYVAAAWEVNEGGFLRTKARVFDAMGRAVSDVISFDTVGNQYTPTITTNAVGGFTVQFVGEINGNRMITGNSFTFDGTAITNQPLSHYLTSGSGSYNINYSMISSLSGSRVIATYEKIGTAHHFKVTRYDSASAVTETIIPGQGSMSKPEIATLAVSNSTGVVWSSGSGDASEIYFLAIDQFGGVRPVHPPRHPKEGQMAPLVINSGTAGVQKDPVIAAAPFGGFAVAWVSGTGDTARIMMREVRSDLIPLGSDIPVSVIGNVAKPSIASLPDGKFIVAWEDRGENNGRGTDIKVQFFDSRLNPIGTTFALELAGNQFSPTIKILADGRAVLEWVNQDGSVRAQILEIRDAGIDKTGTSRPDMYVGTVHTDTIRGEGGNDTLYGGDGADRLFGGAGNDTLIGGTGADHLDGGDGRNTASYYNATGPVTVDLSRVTPNQGDAAGDTYVNIQNVTGTSGADLLVGDENANSLVGGAGFDKLIGGMGADTLDGGADFDFVSYERAVARENGLGVKVVLFDPSLNEGEAAGDIYANIEGYIGSDHHDEMHGSHLGDEFRAGGGNDTLVGYGGADNLFGDGGNDILVGGADADRLSGGQGFDWASYSGASQGVRADLSSPSRNTSDAMGDIYDSIEGLIGSSHRDELFGNLENNDLRGGDGDDDLYGSGGDDTLIGGAGADQLTGGAGTDIASYEDAWGGVRVDLTNSATNTGDAVGDRFFTIEILRGSRHADELVAGAGIYHLQGGDGNDALWGSDLADTLDGGAGSDVASYSNYFSASGQGIVINLFNPGLNTGAAAGDVYRSIEGFVATTYGDTMIGADADDIFYGVSGNDSLAGGRGNDTLDGGGDNDTLAGGTGADLLRGSDGIDTATYWSSGARVEVDLLLGTASGGDAEGDRFESVENLVGSNYNDVLRGDHVDNTLEGGAGDDVLEGRGGSDTMRGQRGNDTYYADTSDVIQEAEGEGYDRLYATNSGIFDLSDASIEYIEIQSGLARVHIIANREDNTLIGNELANTLEGGEGNDVLDGRGGGDLLIGGSGNDTYHLRGRNDIFIEATGSANGSNDVAVIYFGGRYELAQDLGIEVLRAAESIDPDEEGRGVHFIGNAGSRHIITTAYSDTLDGSIGSGPHTLNGGRGDDLYYIRNAGDIVEGENDENGGNDTAYIFRANYASNAEMFAHRDALLAAGIETVIHDLAPGEDEPITTISSDLVVETAFQGTFIGTLSSQGTAGRTYAYTLVDDAGGRFTLDGDRILVQDGVKIDFEQAMFHNVQVQITDDQNNVFYKTITLSVLNAMIEIVDGGPGNDRIYGDVNDDQLRGGLGDDTLVGGQGMDELTGGEGKDVFVFNEIPGAHNWDRITDFNVADDKIFLSTDVFTRAGGDGVLAETMFHVGLTATAGTHRIIYHKQTGRIFYDPDGRGPQEQKQVAQITGPVKPDLLFSHFELYSVL